jgi:hypothetical protein
VPVLEFWCSETQLPLKSMTVHPSINHAIGLQKTGHSEGTTEDSTKSWKVGIGSSRGCSTSGYGTGG